MKRTRKPEERERISTAAPQPQEEALRLILRIEELEPRLTPQSTSGILE